MEKFYEWKIFHSRDGIFGIFCKFAQSFVEYKIKAIMRKYILSLVLAALVVAGAWAQENRVKVSVNVGPQWSSDLGVLVGADALIPFGESRWGFEPGLYWSYRNVSSDHSDNSNKEESTDKLHYINVPLRLAVRVAGHEDSPFNMSILFGPYFAYGVDGTSRCTIMKDGQTTQFEHSAFSDEGRLSSRFDYGLNLGLSAVIKQHIKVGVFTEIGLKDIYRPSTVAEDLIGDLFGITKTNLGGGITVGYQF